MKENSDDLERAIEKVSEVNLMYEIGLIMLIVSIALRLISMAGYFVMGSIGVISLPSFLVSHDFLQTTFGMIVFVTGSFFAIVSYILSKDNPSKNMVFIGASLALLGSLLPPLDIFMILGATLLLLSLRR